MIKEKRIIYKITRKRVGLEILKKGDVIQMGPSSASDPMECAFYKLTTRPTEKERGIFSVYGIKIKSCKRLAKAFND